MKSAHRIITAFLLCAAIVFASVTMSGCNGKNVLNNTQAVVSGGHDVLNAMSATDPSFAKVQKFVNDAQAMLDAYKNARTPGECANVVVIAGDVVSAFQSAILPLITVSPALAAMIAGIDVALRVVAANIHACVQSQAAKAAKASKAAAAVASDALNADGILSGYLTSPSVKR